MYYNNSDENPQDRKLPQPSRKPQDKEGNNAILVPNSPPPRALPLILENVPDGLKVFPNFVAWGYRWDPNKRDKVTGQSGAWNKPLFALRTGKYASSTNPATWCGFGEATKILQQHPSVYNGLGFCFTKAIGLVGIDLDGVRDPKTGALSKEAQEIMRLVQTYHEVSPSGTGIHLLAFGILPEGGRRSGNVEAYDSGRYFTLTGHRLPDSPATINECSEEIKEFHARFIAKKSSKAVRCQGALTVVRPAPLMDTDEELLGVMFAAPNGEAIRRLYQGDTSGYDGDASRADAALCRALRYPTKGDRFRIDRMFRHSRLFRPKWDVIHSGDKKTYGEMTLDFVLRGDNAFIIASRTSQTLDAGKANNEMHGYNVVHTYALKVDEIIEAPEKERDDLLRALMRDLIHADVLERERIKSRLVGADVIKSVTFNTLLKQFTSSSDGGGSRVVLECYTANGPNVVDVVEHEGVSAFLIGDDEGVRIVSSFESEGVRYLPPPIEGIPFLLPHGDQVVEHYDNDSVHTLYLELRVYLYNASELEEAWYDLLACFILHTYLVDFPDVDYSPTIAFVSQDTERGKSRTAKAVTYAARRGLVVSDLREAYLIRFSHEWGGLVTFNTHDIWQEAKDGKCTDVILNRFEKGARVPRVIRPDAGPHQHTTYYDVFGPTIITNNASLKTLLESRCLEVTPPIATREFQFDVKEESARHLRERLTAWRARLFNFPLPVPPKPAKGRLGDITRPLLQVIRMACPEREIVLLELIQKLYKQRQDVKAEAPDGQLAAVLSQIAAETWPNDLVPILDIGTRLLEQGVHNGKGEPLSPERIGNWLKRLGFERESDKDRTRIETEKGSKQVRCLRLIPANQRVITSLIVKHGTSSQTSSPTVTSVTPSHDDGDHSGAPSSSEADLPSLCDGVTDVTASHIGTPIRRDAGSYGFD